MPLGRRQLGERISESRRDLVQSVVTLMASSQVCGLLVRPAGDRTAAKVGWRGMERREARDLFLDD